MTLDVFFAAEEIVTVQKQDVASVEAVISVVGAVLQTHWLQRIEETVAETLERLAIANPRQEDIEDTGGLVEGLLALIFARMLVPVDPGRRRIIQDGSQRLLRIEAPRLSLAAADDVELGMREHLRDSRGRLGGLLAGFLAFRGARINTRPWSAQFREILGVRTNRWLEPWVDSWGYRWHNIGLAIPPLSPGVPNPPSQLLVAFNNPPQGPDSRTTPFCVWVHGRRVGASKIRRQIDRYVEAVTSGDAALAREIWPLNPGTTVADFERHFQVAALPPYHFRCRTLIQPQFV